MSSEDNDHPERAPSERGRSQSRDSAFDFAGLRIGPARPRRNAFGESFAPVARPSGIRVNQVDNVPQVNGTSTPSSPESLPPLLDPSPVPSPPAPASENRTALIAARGSPGEQRRVSATGRTTRPRPILPQLNIVEAPHRSPSLGFSPRPGGEQQLPYAFFPIPGDSEPFPRFADPAPPTVRNELQNGASSGDSSNAQTPLRERATGAPSPESASPIPKPGPAKLGPNSGLDEWLEEAKQCHYLPERVMKELCEMVKEVLMEESNIQPVCTPVTVCGDIHGQFYDLLELFRVSGGMPGESEVEAPQSSTNVITSDDIEPPTSITNPKLKKKLKTSPDEVSGEIGDEESPGPTDAPKTEAGVVENTSSQSADTRYIFLGDFVDRGYFSLETFTLLMCLKAKFPDQIVLVRGNHESRQITQVYGFYEECQQKYGNASVWKACCHVFDFLVLAAIVDGEILCVHGGLSPEIRTIDQIRVVARAQEIPHEGAFCDLVWSDPEDIDTWAVSPRGAGWLFGNKVATEFNHVNGLKLIARAHQLVNEGYKYHFPQNSVVTVWSAPNYCYRCGNVASIMTVDRDLNPKFSIFSAVPDEQRHVPPNRRGPSDYFL